MPKGVRVNIMWRSVVDRVSHSLTFAFEEVKRVSAPRARRVSACERSSAWRNVERVAPQVDLVAVRDVGVRQVHREHRDLLLHGRAEQEGLPVLQSKFQPAQVAHPFVIEPLLAVADGQDVALGIEDREGVAVLKDADPIIQPRAGGHDVVLVLDLDYLVHDWSFSTSWW